MVIIRVNTGVIAKAVRPESQKVINLPKGKISIVEFSNFAQNNVNYLLQNVEKRVGTLKCCTRILADFLDSWLYLV
jgi:hypothetical protein